MHMLELIMTVSGTEQLAAARIGAVKVKIWHGPVCPTDPTYIAIYKVKAGYSNSTEA